MEKFLYNVRIDNTAIITSYSGSVENSAVQIPNKIDGRVVTEIGSNAFKNQDLFTASVEILHGIKKIGRLAFAGCKYLEFVTIPASVITIDSDAFADCPSLSEVRFMGDLPVVDPSIFKRSLHVEVFYYSTKNGWDINSLAGRPLRVLDESAPSLGDRSDDEDDRDVASESGEFVAEEERILMEEREEADLWHYEEVQYKAEVKAYERVTFGTEKTTSLKNVSNPREAFKLRLEKAWNSYSNLLDIRDPRNLQSMLDPVILIRHIEFKNPTAYMLGYSTITNNRIDERKFSKAQVALDTIAPNEDIVSADILRYSFYWQDVLLPQLRV